MKYQSLKVDKRNLFGRKVKKLRREGILPANIYGKKIKSVAVQVDRKDFEKVLKEAGETQIIELLLGQAKKPALIHNVSEDPVTDTVIHVDFLQVDLKEKVTAQVPVELIGEAPAEKEGKGIVVQQIDEIEVEALPTDLPEKFEVELSPLKDEDDVILVKDIKVDIKKIKINNDSDQVIVKVEKPKEEVEAPPAKEATKEEREEGQEEEGKEEEQGKLEEVPTKKEELEKQA